MAAWAELGVVPADAVAAVRDRARVDVEPAIGEIERPHPPRRARVHRVGRRAGRRRTSRWFHYGLTSSDVVDTGLALQLRDAGRDPARRHRRGRRRASAPRREELRAHADDRPHPRRPRRADHLRPEAARLGRCELRRERVRLRRGARRRPRRQAVGRGGRLRQHRPARRGARRCARSGSTASRSRRRSSPATATPRCLARSPAPAPRSSGSRLEIRHLQRTEVREAIEPFAAGQKGSSAMPHKRNPIVVRAHLRPGAGAARRTPSSGSRTSPCGTSATSRTPRPSGSSCPTRPSPLDYMLDRTRWLIEGLEVDAERMLRNLEASHGLVFSGRCCCGWSRPGLTPRGRLRDRPAKRPARLGRRACRCASCSRPTPTRPR